MPTYDLSSIPPLEHGRIPNWKRCAVLGEEITELCGYINAGTYQLLEMIREFDMQGGWHQEGIVSCAHWLNWKCGIGMNAAREKVRVANALGDLPNTSASFAKGEISYSKVRAMTRVATAENEDYLLMIAHHGTAHHVETLVRKYRHARKLQDLQEANKQHDERSFQYFYEADGAISLHIRLPAEKGALVIKAVELATQQADAETKGPAEEGQQRESFERRKADAIADIAESYLANGPAASSSADRYQVMLHVSAETLTNNEGDISHIEDDLRRPKIESHTASNAPRAQSQGPNLPVSGLHPQTLHRWAPHRALVGGWRDQPRQPGAALPASSPVGARGRLLLSEKLRGEAGISES